MKISCSLAHIEKVEILLFLRDLLAYLIHHSDLANICGYKVVLPIGINGYQFGPQYISALTRSSHEIDMRLRTTSRPDKRLERVSANAVCCPDEKCYRTKSSQVLSQPCVGLLDGIEIDHCGGDVSLSVDPALSVSSHILVNIHCKCDSINLYVLRKGKTKRRKERHWSLIGTDLTSSRTLSQELTKIRQLCGSINWAFQLVRTSGDSFQTY